jgi:two-component system, sensor histidine kinase
MKATTGSRLTGTMTPEERACVVVALDHDARQPRHAIEMGLRSLRLIVPELEAVLGDDPVHAKLPARMKSELASVQVAIRQVVDAQQDLVDAIRLEFDDTRPTMRTIAVAEVVERARRSNRGLAGAIELRVGRSRLSFVSDERWIERILNNLIANAVWHSDGSRIFVGARRRGGDIVFEVRDNGRGMSVERSARVFEPLKAPALSPIGCSAARSGLGLYNVRLFTERLGGSVSCASLPGRGTVFRVRLPGPVERIAPRAAVAGGTVAAAARDKMVAILDADLAVLRATEKAFEALGIEVYADHDPLRWLSVVTDMKRMPDLILLDYELKGQDCSLQLDIVRRKWNDRQPKIFVTTGQASSPGLLRIAQDVPVLQKPLSDPKFDLILEVLSGQRGLPDAGLL